jgi:hypothetical protein
MPFFGNQRQPPTPTFMHLSNAIECHAHGNKKTKEKPCEKSHGFQPSGKRLALEKQNHVYCRTEVLRLQMLLNLVIFFWVIPLGVHQITQQATVETLRTGK